MSDLIFYSWQSDCPSNTNRNFISTALEKAIEEIKKDESVAIEPVIDRDTLGLAGSPDISQSIFSKIDAASVFVCDVSIIDSKSTRLTPNPNILIELGYAIKTLGWNRVIMVMNTEFGKPEELPFDLRSKRVLTYCISSDAEEKSPVRNALSKTLVAALTAIFDNHGSMSTSKHTPVTPKASEIRETDIELFERLREDLPSKGSISFIDEQNMAGFSWPRSKLDQLEAFYHEWGDAEHEFLDQDIESLRAKLYKLTGEYLGQIAINTVPASNPEYRTVPPEWEETNSKQFFEVVNNLHESAGEIVKTHQDLIRLGRQKLSL
ncbi:hypothetical protein ACXRSW_01470 [Aeromonas dhakensis]|uniref:hypothetical protein n=1 Tax=Aeromonas dhakensis TaxID=196024 RepID=UPI00059DF086|nr:hypothetical protein [Aeromonas dhakensis]MDD9307509.1 nucleotide-binding protein [Aeromonas hydrophila]UCM51564.1 nucleotide-binding protein [Aeromonas dhakensis]WPS57447.1 hypothetical protein RDV79_02050 [Aeromonas dhakensis]WRT74967.1 hypothetical protein VK677_10000 [Aeromonas dhakensis]CAD7491024.1 hypothetical protein KBAD45_17870 [Aeromonas dhakensis]